MNNEIINEILIDPDLEIINDKSRWIQVIQELESHPPNIQHTHYMVLDTSYGFCGGV